MKRIYVFLALIAALSAVTSLPVEAQEKAVDVQETALDSEIDRLVEQLDSQVISWRRHFHQYPELSNREFKTAAKVAEHLKSLGLEVQTGVAHTGVVAVLRGQQPRPVVALRADMDALPVVERVDLPFASKERTSYEGRDVGVMHACGHDAHTAMLMGVASVLSQLRERLPGTIKFIFQPAEEGAPKGEQGGAKLMIAEGVLRNPNVDAIFGLHVFSRLDVGQIAYRPGGFMASSDILRITVKGRQTHGSEPWAGRDPIVAAAQIINGLQTVVSRQTNLTKAPAVVSIGSIHGGIRSNIIPEEVRMVGTIRVLDSDMQKAIHERIRRVATKIAESMETTAEVEISGYAPVAENDPILTERMLPTLKAVAGSDNVKLIPPITGAEDFSFFQRQVPGLFFAIGVKPKDVPVAQAAPHHTPDFFVDESGLAMGVRAMAHVAVDYLLKASQ